MRIGLFFYISVICAVLASAAYAQPGPVTVDLSTPAARAATVEAKRIEAEQRKARAEVEVRRYGGPIRGQTPDGQLFELVAWEDGGPVYFITQNRNAAISTAADLVRNTAPYNVNGSGYTVGVWDGGAVRDTHQEFGGRVNVIDTGATSYHSTHVAGTIGAAGVVASAQGMAPSVTIDSYNWTNDESEMSGRGATFPGESGSIYLSNHSYGLVTGWVDGDWSGTYGPHWFGVWGEAEDRDFGRYDTSYSQDWDAVCYAAPYFLPFKSSGNDRNDSAPSSGTTFYYYSSGWQSKSYVVGSDPAGDGDTNGGYDTIGLRGVAKNIMTVGAVEDAVSGTVRSVAAGAIADFSGWGPTDDGRVKPDIVANGVSLYSCSDSSDTAYLSIGGTSMSTPNACGSAALLVDLYGGLFPGDAMLSSLLKAVIIHTADDPPMSNAGPDYAFGWGLMDTEAAAAQIRMHGQYPSGRYMSTGTLNSGNPSDTFSFVWNDADPIRATLCWTDPPGPGQSGLDDTTPMLVNDLDLRIYGPGGSPTYYPYVLDVANPGNVATTGDNVVDNVEQVYIASPPAAGMYTVEISHKGSLTYSQQTYALVLSGQRLDALDISPVEDYAAAGPWGGPFAPASKNYLLTNTGGTTLSWTAGVSAAWLDVSSMGGTLPASGSVMLTVSINANANVLPPGTHTDVLTIENTTTGYEQAIGVSLVVRPVDHFTWAAIASPQGLNQPFGVTISALDSTGALTPGFTGVTTLKGYLGLDATIGTGTAGWAYPLATYYHDARTQSIYLQSEVGGTAAPITSLALDVSTLPGQTMSAWTIRMKHTALSSYATAAWESADWTTVYQNNETVAATGWVVFEFTTPFAYNGSDNLMVDFSFNNSSWTSDGYCRYTDVGSTRSLYYRTDSGYGDPLTWSGTSNPTPTSSTYIPNVILGMAQEVAISPTATGSFTAGVWTGDVTVLETGSDIYLNADDGSGAEGNSNLFDVIPVPQVVDVTSPHADGTFSSGEAIDVEVTFSEAVVVTGTPTLSLNVGTANGIVDYASGSGTDTLVFAYVSASGDVSADLDYINTGSLDLNGGSIRDAATSTIDAGIALPPPGWPSSLGGNKDIVIDTVAPTAQCQDITVPLSSPTILPGDVDDGSSDNVAITAWSINGQPSLTPTCANVLSSPIAVTLAVADAAGNFDTCTAYVTVVDDIGPQAACQDITVYLSSPTISGADLDAGSSVHCGPMTQYVDGGASRTFSCSDVAASPVGVTLAVQDALGAFDQCTAQVTVVDDVGPQAVCQDITVYLSSPTAEAADFDGGSSVACGPMTLYVDGGASRTFSCSDLAASPVSVIFTVQDALGAFDQCTAHVTVVDDVGPQAVCQDITVGLSSPTITGVAIDGGSSVRCGPMTRFVDGAASRTFTCADVLSSPIAVTLTVEDGFGQTDQCTAHVTVVDDVGPDAVCQDITVYLSSPIVAAADLDGGSSVQCGPMTLLIDGAASRAFTCTDAAASPVPVILTVEDGFGQTAQCAAEATVVDDIGPRAACQDLTVYLSSPVITGADLDDGSSVLCGPMTLLVDGASSRTFTCADVAASPVAVTLTVEDALGASNQCIAQVTVVDDIGPQAACQDLTVYLSSPVITGADLDDGSSVHCGPMTLLVDGVASRTFTCADVAASPVAVTLTVEDGLGASDQCVAQVTVVDDIGPHALCQDITVYLSSPTITGADLDAGSSVRCGPMTLLVDGAASRTFSCADVAASPLPAMLTVEDTLGETAQCTAQVTVLDDVPPVAVCREAQVVVNGALGVAEIAAEALGADSTDNCALGGFLATPSTIPGDQLGLQSVVVSVTDASGNSDSCLATVNVLPPLDVTYIGPTDTPGGDVVTIVRGNAYEFEVAVSGGIVGDLNYQWRYSAGAKAFMDIPGATLPVYTIDPAEFGDAGSYLCEVWDDLNADQSRPITLVVDPGVPAAGLLGLGGVVFALAGIGCAVLRRKR